MVIDKTISNKKRGIKILILMVFSILFLINFVSAFAVSSAYWEENPLKLSQGETKDIQIILQNIAGTEDINAKAEISTGSEIVEITDPSDVYSVPVGEKTTVNIRVSIPANVKIGEVYNLKFTFTTIKETEKGAFGFGSSITRNFDVIVIPTAEQEAKLEKQKQITQWVIYLIIGIAILIAIIFFITKKKKVKGKK